MLLQTIKYVMTAQDILALMNECPRDVKQRLFLYNTWHFSIQHFLLRAIRDSCLAKFAFKYYAKTGGISPRMNYVIVNIRF